MTDYGKHSHSCTSDQNICPDISHFNSSYTIFNQFLKESSYLNLTFDKAYAVYQQALILSLTLYIQQMFRLINDSIKVARSSFKSLEE
jgi:hypothetical protein